METALAHPGDNVAVVVSAMGGKPKVTDMLLDLVTLAAAGNTAEYTTRLAQIEQKHMEAIEVCARVCVRVCACVCVCVSVVDVYLHLRVLSSECPVHVLTVWSGLLPARHFYPPSLGRACAARSPRTLTACGTCFGPWWS